MNNPFEYLKNKRKQQAQKKNQTKQIKVPSTSFQQQQNYNIFTAPQRNANSILTNPPKIKGISQQQKQQYLRQSHQKQSQAFNYFMQRQYIKFQMKVNNALYNCISNDNIQKYEDINNCQEKCRKGMNKFEQFVNGRIQQMQTLLNGCVQNTRKLPNSLQQVYLCYDMYNKGFKQLKTYIIQQSMYYQ